jgi:hypothetical protein
MSKFTSFTIEAVRDDGTRVKFSLNTQDRTAQPVRGNTHDEAFNASTDLYNVLVKDFQGE